MPGADKLPDATDKVTHVVSSYFHGPVPPAEFAREWAEIYGEAPRMIFEMAVRNQKHRHREDVREFIYRSREFHRA